MKEGRELEALRGLVAVAERLGIPLLLVGAFARKLGFDDPRRLQPSRTRDWDFAADVPSLEAYERLLDVLHEELGFTVSKEQGTAHAVLRTPEGLARVGGARGHRAPRPGGGGEEAGGVNPERLRALLAHRRLVRARVRRALCVRFRL